MASTELDIINDIAYPERVRELLASGASPNTTFKGKPALYWALDYLEAKTAGILIAAGATLSTRELRQLIESATDLHVSLFHNLMSQKGTLALDNPLFDFLIERGITGQLSDTELKVRNDIINVEERLKTKFFANTNNARALVAFKGTSDPDWIVAQDEYIESLPEADKHVLRAYTYHGDVLMNLYQRRMFDVAVFMRDLETNMPVVNPFTYLYMYEMDLRYVHEINRAEFVEFIRSYWEPMIQVMIEKLKEIIRNAPRPTRPIRVFRGVWNYTYLESKFAEQDMFETVDFLSTSLAPAVAVNFTKIKKGGERIIPKPAIIEILIQPGTPCLFMEGITQVENELEVIVPPDVQITFRANLMKRFNNKSMYTYVVDASVA
jgi:ADP-ribosyltransferase exoenzyme